MRRSKYDIFADILRAALEGAKKTRIVYASNLNFNLLNKYLPRLFERGFLEVTEDGCYLTTSKGTQFLKEYNELLSIFSEAGGGTNKSFVQLQKDTYSIQ